jgi:putative phosphotransacetylase
MNDDPDFARLGEEVARRVKERLAPTGGAKGIRVPVGVSGRHVHVTREVVEALFGRGHQLTPMKDLTQAREFAARETVTLVGPRGTALEGVRVLGPTRPYTQIELARSDGLRLGLDLPVRKTGDLGGTPGLTVVGPAGTVVLTQGAIRATRHVHVGPDDAIRLGLRDGQVMRARVGGPRALVLGNVLIRVREGFVLDFHLDTDDANAAGLETGSLVELLPE